MVIRCEGILGVLGQLASGITGSPAETLPQRARWLTTTLPSAGGTPSRMPRRVAAPPLVLAAALRDPAVPARVRRPSKPRAGLGVDLLASGELGGTIALGPLIAVGGTVWKWQECRQQALRYGLLQLDALQHRDFEYAVRDLMRRDGCADARQIGGAGDNGADVLATGPSGLHWGHQCEYFFVGDRRTAVGTPDLQRVNGTARQLYGADEDVRSVLRRRS
ncbi:restriction endonuclease [Streptomyces sp. 058-1L]|uniref:restriction endonuclease n=1 Tax=Streptomyces sp. 058-1L TaxID=2789266 RepID=UPI00397EE86F